MSWLSHCPAPQHQPQSRSKMQQYRVQIRDKQLNALKNTIRQEMLRSNTIEDLLQNLPKNIQQANCWARELYQAYSQTRRYSLSIQHIIDIFKVVETFSNRNTLLLFEVVIIRATRSNADFLFQYDVMRVLHGFITFTGRNQLVRCPSSTFSIEEGKIINEMVISSAVQNIQRNSAEEENYTSRLESARITLRVIADLCRKAPHVRNFAVINHKTYTYCLNAHKCFQKEIDNQFYNFLEAATHIPFDRFQDQFTRISVKILHLFYRAKMNVRIELLAEKEERSYLTAYESLVQAMGNLFMMENQRVRAELQGMENHQGTATLGLILDIIVQCNYVMEFPAAHQQNETLMPIKLMQAALDLGMRAIQAISKPFPNLLRHPIYEQYASELIRFLRNRDISFGYGAFVLARRMATFQLDLFIFQIKQDQAKMHNFIAFNPQNRNDNMIALITYLMQSDTDIDNKIELCVLTTHIMEHFPAFTFQPFISNCQLFRIMLDRLVQLQTWCSDSLQSSQQALKRNILYVLLTFLTSSLPQIMTRLPYYTSLISEYSHRIQNLLLQQHMPHVYAFGVQLLQWLGDHTSEL